jgi:nitroreductase/NAD-dependent dihydropyrimidine dehydrogenase PreA subunit
MLDFKIDGEKCTKCGQCVKDCPIKIIEMTDGLPFIKEEREKHCMKCQHCVAVCPTAALSILGVSPDDCVDRKLCATEEALDALIRNRRSVRQFKKKDVAQEKLEKLFRTAANAPTGKNTRTVQLHVIDNMADMDAFREKVIAHLEKLDAEGKLKGGWEFFSSVVRAFRNGQDLVFRGAPHLVVASLPEDGPCPDADGMITLSYLELMASAMGLGTVWLGFLMYIFQLAPEIKGLLNIPEGHKVAYAMLVGEPSVKYYRGVVRDEITVNRVSFGS